MPLKMSILMKDPEYWMKAVPIFSSRIFLQPKDTTTSTMRPYGGALESSRESSLLASLIHSAGGEKADVRLWTSLRRLSNKLVRFRLTSKFLSQRLLFS